MDDLSPDSSPAFLTLPAELPVQQYDDLRPTFDDELIPEDPTAPSRGIINRYREVARLHSAGKTNNEICAHLGYTPCRMSLILKDPFVQSEIRRWRDLMHDDDAIGILKQAARDGAQRVHSIILDPKAKDTTVLAASAFAIEKTHGKAKQEVSLESGTLNTFMEMLKDMRSRGEVIDVSPEARRAEGPGGTESPQLAQAQGPDTQRNKFDNWLDAELA